MNALIVDIWDLERLDEMKAFTTEFTSKKPPLEVMLGVKRQIMQSKDNWILEEAVATTKYSSLIYTTVEKKMGFWQAMLGLFLLPTIIGTMLWLVAWQNKEPKVTNRLEFSFSSLPPETVIQITAWGPKATKVAVLAEKENKKNKNE